jgi:hypothetical protein
MKNQQPKLIDQGLAAIKHLRSSPEFISNNKLWKGYWNAGWFSKVSLILAAICSWKLITQFRDLFSPETSSEIFSMGLLQGMGQVSNKIFINSGVKYLILIILEMVIFYFSVKTYEILSKKERTLELKDFITAQIRMVKVAALSWIYEMVIGVVLSIFFGIFGFEILSKALGFFVEFFFIGAAFMDNYNEQFHLSINESFKKSFTHIGAALIIGLFAYVVLLIPAIGVVFAPFFCAVAATCYMFYNEGPIIQPKELV